MVEGLMKISVYLVGNKKVGKIGYFIVFHIIYHDIRLFGLKMSKTYWKVPPSKRQQTINNNKQPNETTINV